jgi:hypothetical protein
VIDRVEKYLSRKAKEGLEYISFRAIQSCFSPDCPSMAEIADAINALNYNWFIDDGKKFVYLY